MHSVIITIILYTPTWHHIPIETPQCCGVHLSTLLDAGSRFCCFLHRYSRHARAANGYPRLSPWPNGCDHLPSWMTSNVVASIPRYPERLRRRHVPVIIAS